MGYLFLALAILSEVAATLCLRVSAAGDRRWYLGVFAGYVASFTFLTLTLHDGVGLGAAYGIWAASGVALTALASKRLFDEPLTKVMGLGIVLIITGVLMIELGTH